ncbi:MAG: hypothetical protein KME28_17605 [Pelatocladus maniniholoensis HA4357-MV3]|jgi:hypothetical protein|uniref:Uncharacterized protein n=1 Tax=Pelatocladus maniniholoensis HA4357-MV3 TaxID=1117104 RepID=A0A9E3LU55_9NOST|nr:hypothetical protein [Pelatocladus maniniholoensis HA4357-MV3]
MLASSRQSIGAFFSACLCILGVSLLQFPHMQQLISSHKTASLASLEREINAEKLRLNLLKKMPHFGYNNLIANCVYLDFLQYFGDDEVRAKTGYSLSPEYFEVILKRDPRFLEAYLSLSTSTSMYAAMPERSIALMKTGLKSLSPWVPSKSYYVWRYKGIDELLFLGDSQNAKQSFQQAANWANNHTDEESKQVAEFSQKTADFLERNPDSKYAQIATWMMVLNNQVDEKTHQRAIIAIETFGGKVIKNPDGSTRIRLPKQD